ncbi:hypothetical protein F4824DRAFT_373597 [Ustulina deusta]|nr:hypothetical protein F4824DRAFT_373597 [Ustulina deusta]
MFLLFITSYVIHWLPSQHGRTLSLKTQSCCFTISQSPALRGQLFLASYGAVKETGDRLWARDPGHLFPEC